MQIEFQTPANTPHIVTLNQNAYTFQTPKRYEKYATAILDVYEELDDDLVELFNTTLEDVTVTFFIPDFGTIFFQGDFVPFTGKVMGAIHINVFFVRYWAGIFELIAVHELVHHFLWSAGASPEVIWPHEGIAQMISIELVEQLGYEGATMEKQKIGEATNKLIGANLGFLQSWTPEKKPTNVGIYYFAAHYIVRQLAGEYEEFHYFACLFESINDRQIAKDENLVYHLSLAANTSVVPLLRDFKSVVDDQHTFRTHRGNNRER